MNYQISQGVLMIYFIKGKCIIFKCIKDRLFLINFEKDLILLMYHFQLKLKNFIEKKGNKTIKYINSTFSINIVSI